MSALNIIHSLSYTDWQPEAYRSNFRFVIAERVNTGVAFWDVVSQFKEIQVDNRKHFFFFLQSGLWLPSFGCVINELQGYLFAGDTNEDITVSKFLYRKEVIASLARTVHTMSAACAVCHHAFHINHSLFLSVHPDIYCISQQPGEKGLSANEPAVFG